MVWSKIWRTSAARVRRGSPGWCEVAAPAAEVDSGEHQFVATSGDEALDVAENRGVGKASRGAAGLGDYAEGAAVAATLLDFEIGAGLGAGDYWGLFEEGVGEGVVGEDQRADLRPAGIGC